MASLDASTNGSGASATNSWPNPGRNPAVSLYGQQHTKASSPYHTFLNQNNAPLLRDETYKEQRSYKFEGYPGFSKWMASSNDFFVLRRFGSMNARVLLLMQWRIGQVEKQILQIDQAVRDSPDEKARNGCFHMDIGSPRERLLNQLIPMLDQYNRYIKTFSTIKARSSAPDHQVRNLENYFTTYPDAVNCEPEAFNECDFLNYGGDLIPLVPKEKSPMRRMLETSRFIRLSKIFNAKPRPAHADGGGTHYASEAGFDLFVSGFIIIGGLLLLFGPMWTLQFVADDVYRLGIITGFVFLFTLVLWMATVNRPFEVLGATAAYCAVLMVFLQIGSGNNNN